MTPPPAGTALLRVSARDRSVDVPLRGAVRIGADPSCDVVVRRADLAAFHVRVAPCGDGGFAVETIGARDASLNGAALTASRTLVHGDEIVCGTARLTFLRSPQPNEAAVAAVAPNERRPASGAAAGVPLAASRPHSSASDPVPGRSVGRRSPGVPPPTRRTCAVCQCDIAADESWLACRECGLPYHEDCWRENFGCAAYGCAQVDSLRAGPDLRLDAAEVEAGLFGSGPEGAPAATFPTTDAPDAESFPWEHSLLAASVASALLSLGTFGLPSLVAGAAAAWTLLRSTAAPAVPELRWTENGWASAPAHASVREADWLVVSLSLLTAIGGVVGGLYGSLLLYSN